MEYPQSTFKQFKILIEENPPLEVFKVGDLTVSWYDCTDFKRNDNLSISKKLSDDYIRVDTNSDGEITRVEDEFINLPDNKWEMGWY